ncbi:methionine--tRNA ligase [Candidatus Woesearchaeota archaeon]|nr:methionine--tRNA ligase [Candidatus Woesearchaeota archaeon]
MKVLITSALPYVNNVPHMGNIIGCVLSADVFARFKRSQGEEVLYVCGTDEHGTTTEAKAIEEGVTPQEICDKYYKIHKDVYDWFGISFDIFGRTSTENHTEIVHDIFKTLDKNGYIQAKEVEQTYCSKEEKYLADRFIEGTCPHCGYEHARGDQCESCGKLLDPHELKNPKCKFCGTTPILKKTEHLFLDLEKLQPELEQWVKEASAKGRWTQNALSTTEAWLKKGLEPRAITRDLKWGVPVPGKKDKVFYVWFDAPIGYISITGQHTDWKSWWKDPDVKLYQFMAKDNIPFHTILFPASLIGTKEEWTMLHHINSTEYLQHEDGKFSKSRGTGLFGDDAMKTGIPADAFRYYLLINRPEKSDATFTWKDLQDKLNGELLANLGNLVNRTLVFISKYYDNKIPDKKSELDITEDVKKVTELLEWANEKEALKAIMTISQKGNQYFQENQPWKTRTEDPEKCEIAISSLANLVKDLAILIEPFLPDTSKRIFEQLAVEPQTWESIGKPLGSHTIGKTEPLFEKLDDKKLAKIKEQLKSSKPVEVKPLQLRAGKITKVEKHPEADKLYIETVDFGDHKRTIVSGLVDHYSMDELEGKTCAWVTNLKPAKLRGIESQGMILAADDGKAVEVAVTNAKPGEYLLGDGSEEEITIDEFAVHKLEVKNGKALIDGEEIVAYTKKVLDGKLR